MKFAMINPIRPCWTATASLLLFSAAALQAQPAPAPPAPPEPPRAFKVMTFGGPVSYLGIGVKEITTERSKELKLKEEAGVEVTRVDPDSPAEKAGLKTGDAVLEYQGGRVEGSEQFVRLVRETPAGRQVKLKISRAGSTQNLTATIGERKSGLIGLSDRDRERVEREMARVRERIRAIPEVRVPDLPRPVMGWRSGMLGIDGEGVEEQLAEFFGVKEGVLVRSVNKDMPAAKAGIKSGDIIVKVEETKVRSPRDITAAIRNAKNKRPIKVTFVRQKVETTLDVAVEEDRPASPRAITITRPQDFDFDFEF